MPVKEELRPFLEVVAAAEGDLTQQTPEGLRQLYDALSGTGNVEEVASVRDDTVPGPAGEVPVRIYTPAGADTSGPGAAGLIYLHGGGWVIGNLESHDNVCRALANAADLVVISVDYRLAPEHPFPAALDDTLAAIRSVSADAARFGVDPARLAVGGDSAGGNLSALACQQLDDLAHPLRFQLLVYPLLDARYETASIEENAEGYFLTKEALYWFRDHYLGDGDPADPRVSPACVADDDLAGLPAGLVITAEFDPLRDEGERYAKRCQAAGVDMALSRYDGMIHGFFSMAELVPDGGAAIREAADALRAALQR